MINDVKLDKQEVKHGTFGGNTSVYFSQVINFNFGDLSNFLLLLNLSGSLLGDFETNDQCSVLKNGSRISIR